MEEKIVWLRIYLDVPDVYRSPCLQITSYGTDRVSLENKRPGYLRRGPHQQDIW